MNKIQVKYKIKSRVSVKFSGFTQKFFEFCSESFAC